MSRLIVEGFEVEGCEIDNISEMGQWKQREFPPIICGWCKEKTRIAIGPFTDKNGENAVMLCHACYQKVHGSTD